MKKLSLALASILLISGSQAMADTFNLGDINTDNCAKAQSEVMILNTAAVKVSAICSEPGSFPSTTAQINRYQLYTTITTTDTLKVGQTLHLNDIGTNDCSYAQSIFASLNSNQYSVLTFCTPAGKYLSDNGRMYNYRVFTSITVK